MHIKVPKGSHGGYLSSGVSAFKSEREWLLPPNAKFRVDKVDKSGSPKAVHLTEPKQDAPALQAWGGMRVLSEWLGRGRVGGVC